MVVSDLALPTAVPPVSVCSHSLVPTRRLRGSNMCVSIVYGPGMADTGRLCLMRCKSTRNNAWLAFKAISGENGDTSCHVLAACMSSGFGLSPHQLA